MPQRSVPVLLVPDIVASSMGPTSQHHTMKHMQACVLGLHVMKESVNLAHADCNAGTTTSAQLLCLVCCGVIVSHVCCHASVCDGAINSD